MSPTTNNEHEHISVNSLFRIAAGNTLGEINNAMRATLAAKALNLFATDTGLTDQGEDARTVITDFLVDLMHLCRSLGVETGELASITATAIRYFTSDVEEEIQPQKYGNTSI